METKRNNNKANNEIDNVYSYYSKDFGYKNIYNKKQNTIEINEENDIEKCEEENDKQKNINDYSVFKIMKTVINSPPPGPRDGHVFLNPYNGEEIEKFGSEESKYIICLIYEYF